MGNEPCCQSKETDRNDQVVVIKEASVMSAPKNLPEPPPAVVAAVKETPQPAAPVEEKAPVELPPDPAPVEEPKVLEVELLNTDNTTVTVTFTTRLLGMKFAGNTRNPGGPKKVRISNVTPGGQSERLGIKENWVITKIGGTSITEIPFPKTSELFKEQASLLPETGSADV